MDNLKRKPQDCPTCNGQVWIVRLGRWIRRRETVGMVCPTCGHDYSKGEPDGPSD